MTQAADLDSTINILQEDLTSVSPAVVITMIERWEEHLAETDLFHDLSELKQAILANDTTAIAHRLNVLGEATIAATDKSSDNASAEVAKKVEEIGRLLSHTGKSLQ